MPPWSTGRVGVAIIAAATSFLGVVLGGLGTFLTQRATVRRQTEAARRQQVIEIQHRAATTFLAQAELFIAEAGELWRCLASPDLHHLIDSVQPRYYDRWCEYRQGYADVRIAGPQSLREASKGIAASLLALARCVDALHVARHADEAVPTEFESATDACRGFAEAAASAFDLYADRDAASSTT